MGRRLHRVSLQAVVGTREPGRRLAERGPQVEQRLLEAFPALGPGRVRDSEPPVFLLDPPGSEAEREATARHVVEGDPLLGEHRRMAERDGAEEVDQLDTLGGPGQPGQHYQGVVETGVLAGQGVHQVVVRPCIGDETLPLRPAGRFHRHVIVAGHLYTELHPTTSPCQRASVSMVGHRKRSVCRDPGYRARCSRASVVPQDRGLRSGAVGCVTHPLYVVV